MSKTAIITIGRSQMLIYRTRPISIVLLFLMTFLIQCNRGVLNHSKSSSAAKSKNEQEKAKDSESAVVKEQEIYTEDKKTNKNSENKDKSNTTQTQKEEVDKEVGKETPMGADWKLVWSDEFDGSNIDTNMWNHEVNCWGGGNAEQQCYTNKSENSFVKDGMLNIVAIEGVTTGRDGPKGDGAEVTLPYSSARLTTKDKFTTRYGRICARAKLPMGQGLWPAIWMLPNNPEYTWAVDGEIDIMEAVNLSQNQASQTEIHGTIHYGGEWPKNVYTGKEKVLAPDSHAGYNFHNYCVEWEEGEIRWFINDTHYSTQRQWYSEKPDGTVANPPAPFNTEFFILLNVAVGGNWPGPPDANTTFPQSMQIDWIRVYECSVDKETGKGCSTVEPEANIVRGISKVAKKLDDTLLLFDNAAAEDFEIGFYDNDTGIISSKVINSGEPAHLQVWDISKSATGAGNGYVNYLGGVLDLSTLQTGYLEFDLKVINLEANTNILIKVDSGWPNVSDMSIQRPAADNTWQSYRLSLAQFIASDNSIMPGNKMNIGSVTNPFVIEPQSQQPWQIQIDNIRITK